LTCREITGLIGTFYLNLNFELYVSKTPKHGIIRPGSQKGSIKEEDERIRSSGTK
jgi:hypothetical protein